LFDAGLHSFNDRCADITAFNQEVSLEKFLSTVGAAGDAATASTTANDTTNGSNSAATPGSAAANNDANYEVNAHIYVHVLCTIDMPVKRCVSYVHCHFALY
jgi:hypothetical protein